MSNPIYKLSVVVCTYNRASILWETLLALADQTVAGDMYEVVVIDNHSTDNTAEIVNLFASEFNNFRAVHEPEQGLSRARNRGYREASADWVAYLDDDALAPPTHIERILQIIDKHPFDSFGGVYIPWYRYGRPKWFKDRYASNIEVQSHLGVMSESGYFSGGNFVINKKILLQLGGFPVTLGMRGKATGYGEETRLQLELRKHGFCIGFDPYLVVRHAVDKKKMSVRWFLKAGYANGRDFWRSYDKRPALRDMVISLLMDIRKTIFRLPRHIIKLCAPRYHIQNFFIDIIHPLSYRLGSTVSGLKTILKDWDE